MDRKKRRYDRPCVISIRLSDLQELLQWAATSHDTNFEQGKQLEMEFDVEILPSQESAPSATESTIPVISTATTKTTTNVYQSVGSARSAIRQPTGKMDSE